MRSTAHTEKFLSLSNQTFNSHIEIKEFIMAFVKLDKLKSSGKSAAKKRSEHPLLKVDGVNENVKQMYLQGVALGSLLDDGEITEKERAYLDDLGASLGIGAADVASCIETVQQLGSDEDKEEFIKEFLALMQPEPIAFLFIADFEGIIDLNEKLNDELIEYLNYFGDGLFHRDDWRDYVWDHEKTIDAERAFARNLKAADAGDGFALADVGRGYYEGIGTTKDLEKAFKYFKSSAEKDCVLGAAWMGTCCQCGLGTAKDAEAAVKWYSLAIAKGRVNSMVNLAFMYRDGNGVPQDFSKAYDIFLRAAKENSPIAQVEAGIILYNGQGVARDIESGLKLVQKGVDGGNAGGQWWLAWRYHNGDVGVDKDFDKASALMLKAAEQGFALAEEALAIWLRNGDGVMKDEKKAFEWFCKSADHGLATAENWVGWHYGTGTCVALDYVEAMKWYLRSAEHGCSVAEWNCSVYYENGYGVSRDLNEAFSWALKAANHGYVQAMANVAARFGDVQAGLITGNFDKDWEQHISWLKKAAEGGDVNSQYEWGYQIFTSVSSEYGTKADAQFWLQKAAAAGHGMAKWQLEHNF